MNGVEMATPYTGTIFYSSQADEGKMAADPMAHLKQSGIDISRLAEDYVSFWTYETPEVTNDFLTGHKEQDKTGMGQEEWSTVSRLPIIGIEDYNRMLALQNEEPLLLNDGEYAVNYAFPPMKEPLEKFRQKKEPLTISGTTLTLANDGIQKHAWENKNVLLDAGTIIVPQYLTENLTKDRWILDFNYMGANKDSAADLREKWMMEGPDNYTLWTRQEALISVTSDNLMVTYLGIYLGITFLITSGAVLALQQMSQSLDNGKRYALLKKMGVSRRDMRRSLMKQLKNYFGFPLVLAALHSAVAVWSLFRYFQGLETSVIVSVAGFSTILVLAVYAIYFITTYVASRRILEL